MSQSEFAGKAIPLQLHLNTSVAKKKIGNIHKHLFIPEHVHRMYCYYCGNISFIILE